MTKLEPIKRTALRLGISTKTAIKWVRQDLLPAKVITFPSGARRYFCDPKDIDRAFSSPEPDWAERAKEACGEC